jgi:hypothetical protein
MHHIREDGSFTAFEQAFPELLPAITRLRVDHHDLGESLRAYESLLRRPDVDAESVWTQLDRVAAGLEEHFAYEEKQIQAATRS